MIPQAEQKQAPIPVDMTPMPFGPTPEELAGVAVTVAQEKKPGLLKQIFDKVVK